MIDVRFRFFLLTSPTLEITTWKKFQQHFSGHVAAAHLQNTQERILTLKVHTHTPHSIHIWSIFSLGVTCSPNCTGSVPGSFQTCASSFIHTNSHVSPALSIIPVRFSDILFSDVRWNFHSYAFYDSARRFRIEFSPIKSDKVERCDENFLYSSFDWIDGNWIENCRIVSNELLSENGHGFLS